MKNQFRDRVEGGQLLAAQLAKYANRKDVIVLGLPRGGVPVAFEVARELNAPLDVFVVRKLGVPGHRELAMGAIATGGVRVLNERVVQELGISKETIDAVAAEEHEELKRREVAYRGHGASPVIRGKTVILVDDGIATGSTIRAAVLALRKQHPARLIVAVPTAAASSCHELRRQVDEMLALMAPEEFYAVGQWYEDFSQTTDAEVTRLLELARDRPVSAATSAPSSQEAGSC
ncbi:MAG: phosphoribosyltransferase [Verrucomicrobia bacterium]|nr:phosphoribosyltransferase [Verrucomicrobiota bacterium]